MIQRALQSQIEKSLFKGKAVIIYGARQVGKTTLIREIQEYRRHVEVVCRQFFGSPGRRHGVFFS
jgi:predicted AAA+ superfamily ATPase